MPDYQNEREPLLQGGENREDFSSSRTKTKSEFDDEHTEDESLSKKKIAAVAVLGLGALGVALVPPVEHGMKSLTHVETDKIKTEKADLKYFGLNDKDQKKVKELVDDFEHQMATAPKLILTGPKT